MPALDLAGFYRFDGPPTRAALDAAVEGIEAVAATRDDVYAGGFTEVRDDDDAAASVFSYGPPHERRSLAARRVRDAWRLAVERGTVPASWGDDSRRCFADQTVRFFCDACAGLGATGWNYDDLCGDCHGRGSETARGRVAHPTSIVDALWMLSRPADVERAEALAREAVARLGAAGPGSERVQWGRVRPWRPCGTIPVVLQSPVWTFARPRPTGWDWEAMRGPAFARAPWWSVARSLVTLTQEMLCFDVGLAWHHRAAGVTASPMEPVLRLWELGVVIEELTPEAIVIERATARYLRSWRAGVPYG
jgi:hypothetical protein